MAQSCHLLEVKTMNMNYELCSMFVKVLAQIEYVKDNFIIKDFIYNNLSKK